MGRKENRRNQESALKVALATAVLGLAKMIIELIVAIIKWLDR